MARFGDKLYTRKEVATLLRVSVKTVYCWMKPESAPYGITLQPQRLGTRCLRYTAEAVEECLRQRDRYRESLERRRKPARRFRRQGKANATKTD